MITNNKIINNPELLIYKLDFNNSIIEKALSITANYVAEHKLILTGGTAIDMVLRSKGSSIYDENALPDYDIISENNLLHATALAEILCKEGITEINVINAIHITTMRVRVKNITLLDATFIPEILIKKIPYLDIGRFRIVHPNFQKIDQRLSLSTLMSDTGISLNIFNRLSKDIERNKILREYFEINNDKQMYNSEIIPNNIKIFTNRIKLPIKLIKYDPIYMNIINEYCFIYTGDVCVSGFLSYALYYNEFCKKNKPLDGTINPNIKINNEYIEFDLPKEASISILNCSNKAIETLKLLSGVNPDKFKKYNKLTNVKPISIKTKINNQYYMEVSDTYGYRFSSFNLDGIITTSTDYILMEFLRDRIYTESDSLRAINSMYYESLLKMILYIQNNTKPNEKKEIEIDELIWYPSINCYGYDILPEYKVFGMEKILHPEEASKFKPKNSYLNIPQCLTKSKFDNSLSHYFLIDGQENPEIIHTNLKYIVDEIKSL